MKKVVVFLMFSLCPLLVFAQRGLRNDGRDFYIGVLAPGNVTQVTGGASQYSANAIIFAVSGANVTISYFDDLGAEIVIRRLHIDPMKNADIRLDFSRMKMQNPNGEVAEFRACHLVSDAPINVQVVSSGPSDAGSYLALPVQSLGKRYIVMSYHDNIGGLGSLLKSPTDPGANTAGYFMVIATEDGTTLQFVPSTTTANGTVGVHGYHADGTERAYGAVLNRGDCYMVKSPGTSQGDDISGSLVVASRPVVVLAGHENAYTDGSEIGTSPVEQRDFMVEQMIPADCLDTMGYFSLPQVDAPNPASSAYGDEFHVFPAGERAYHVLMNESTDFQAGPYALPVSDALGVDVAAVFRSVNGVPFAVMQYDQRQQGTSPLPPNPAPSMNTIIPQSCWKNEFGFAFTRDTNSTAYQSYYLNIIMSTADYNRGGIMNSFNGKTGQQLQSSGLLLKKTWNFPASYGLMGATYTVPVGSTCYIYGVPAKGDTVRPRFMAYVSGNRNTFGVYSEFSNPAGFSYNRFGADSTNLSISVNQACANWKLCATTGGDSVTGIRYAELINYTNNTFYPPVRTEHNLIIDPSADTSGKGEIIFSGEKKSECFTVYTPNPADSSYGTIAVYDNSGAVQVVSLTTRPILSVVTSANITRSASDTFAYPVIKADSSACGYIEIAALDKSKPIPFSIDSIYFPAGSHVRIDPPLSSFPIQIQAGQSLHIPICFQPEDTTSTSTELLFVKHCGGSFRFVITGKGMSGLIQAGALAIGATDSGSSNCGTLAIRNTGSLPFTLSGGILSDTANFTIDPVFLASLPKVVLPGGELDPTICFHPKNRELHTATITWQTDIPITEGLAAETQRVSFISGQGYDPSVTWSPRSLVILGDTTKPSQTLKGRVYLTNRGALKRILVQQISLAGEDSAEFEIVANEYNQTPLTNFYIAPKDSMWLDVQFKPDLAKPYPAKWADRKTFIGVSYQVDGSTISNTGLLAPVTGRFLMPDAVRAMQYGARTINAFIRGSLLYVAPGETNPNAIDIGLYDLLGRNIAEWNGIVMSSNSDYIALPLPQMASGMYFVRIGQGVCKVMK